MNQLKKLIFPATSNDPAISRILKEQFVSIYSRTDRMFAVLMGLQWLAAIAIAFVTSPFTWNGSQSSIHPHVVMAFFGGGVLALMPIALAVFLPGRTSTRMTIACSQALFSTLLIHLSGGRIETHFHVFGSLAFLAAYRDPLTLAPATLIIAVDHWARGIWWPESVFGIATASQWRWLEHAAWVVFEVVILLIITKQSVNEMHSLASKSVQLDAALSLAEKSEQRFREGFEQSALGMAFKKLDGTYIRINNRYCEITGYSRDELFTKRYQDITHPDDIPLHAKALEQLSSGQDSSCQIDKRYLHKQGHEVWVRLTLSLVRDSDGNPHQLMAAAEDITAERNAQALIKKLSLVASKTRHSVIIAGPNGCIEWVNEGFTNLTGYSAEEAIGNSPGDLLQGVKTDTDTKNLIRKRLQNQESVSVEILNYGKSETPYWINLEIDPVFDSQGNLTNFIATQTDITDRKKRAEQLERATQAAEAANRSKSRFLANMSHEIRTPLNGILGFTDVLLRDWQSLDPSEMDDHLSTIRRSGQHLLSLINDVLDISKIEAEQMQVELLDCSPHQVISDTISILRVTATEKGIGLDHRWEGPVPATIKTDPYRFKQMLLNIVGNAIKFTDQGSVLVVAYLSQETDNRLCIEVRDTGAGIPAEKINAIFEPFVQADDTVTRKYGGTGLGLPISKKIAESLGGTLSVASFVGRGSTFTATIDTGDVDYIDLDNMARQVPQHSHAQNTPMPRKPITTNGLNGMSVLVVDDGDTNRKLIRLLLEREGAKVWMAENGQVAIDMVSRTNFDVILMDMQMPVLDGYTATSRLRQRGFEMPIIALTAHAMQGDREKCLETGCSGYLTKPIDASALYETLSTISRTGEIDESSQAPIRSALPTEDPEFRHIIEQFIDKFDVKVRELEHAWEANDFDEMERIAHWIRGSAGTVGYSCFTIPAAELERSARNKKTFDSRRTLDQIQDLKCRITL
ncbi:PAS domain-containing hybrid sensor histidine kinase/response regulator [Rhodopirellula sp. MGV]|uniref:PAS domain-containing hybrid sensor histidine kinase/response regulator n=1 Tax=Rhodopirellula sp. MGV TaxID=2023130 RepID=UPI000B969BCD|nr:PAS domain S-box protein [Rhodopirellula sp. MGV]OYP33174.1 hypothetical protein CGZ80_18305 [Rhodopirellula sp. MGV]PNY35094.1 PAS domain S-box protein [Rhodopirellula baltica]